MASYISLQDFKDNTGITIETDIITNALNQTAERIKNLIFVFQKAEFYNVDTNFQINTPIADIDCDGEVTKNDIYAYEFEEDNYATPETDRSSNISSFNEKYGYVTFDTSLPTSNKILVIEFYTAKYRNSEMKLQLQRLNELLAVNYLFTTVPFSRLQNGISSWTLNGVSVQFDMNTMKEIKEANQVEIKQLVQDLKPTYSQYTTSGFGNDTTTSIDSYTRSIPYD